MPYVVAQPCINCKHTDCVEVCPVDCFYEGPNFLVIHPDECIDCNACVPACPVEAIYADDELPEDQAHYAQWNEYLAGQWQAPRLQHHREEAGLAGGRGVGQPAAVGDQERGGHPDLGGRRVAACCAA